MSSVRAGLLNWWPAGCMWPARGWFVAPRLLPDCCSLHHSGSSSSIQRLQAPIPLVSTFCPRRQGGAVWPSPWCWGSSYHGALTWCSAVHHSGGVCVQGDECQVGVPVLMLPCAWCSKGEGSPCVSGAAGD